MSQRSVQDDGGVELTEVTLVDAADATERSEPPEVVDPPPPLKKAERERRVRRKRREKAWRRSQAEWSSSSSSSHDYTYESYIVGGSEVSDSPEPEEIPDLALEGPSIHDILGMDKHKKYDYKVQVRNLLIALQATVGIVLMMGEVWVGWDESTRTFDENAGALALKFGVSVSTGLLILQIAEYYMFQVRHERNSWFVADSVSWRQNIVWMFLGEAFVCGIHTYPEFGMDLYDDRLGALMFVRVYLLVRVIRDASPIYRKRLDVLTDKFLKRTGAIEFNWHLSVKFVFLGYIWPFVLGSMALTWFVAAYVLWLLERPGRPLDEPAFTLMQSVWMTVATMSTVGYGDEFPITARGKVAAGITALLGITETALLVFAVMESLSFSTQDNRVRNIVTRRNVLPLRQETSARYIALHWQIYKMKRAAAEVGKTRKDIHHDIKVFAVQNTHFKTTLRALRRELSAAMELDDIVIARLDEKLGNWTGYFALRLARLLGVRRKKEKPYPIPPLPVLIQRAERIRLRQEIIVEKMNQLQVAVLGHDTDVKIRRRKEKASFFETSLVDSIFGLG